MAINPLTGNVGIPQDVEVKPRHYDIQTGDIGNSFGNMLSDAIQGVDDQMKSSATAVQDLVMGKTDNVHDVMIEMQKAQLSFQMMVEVRNKVIETYQEISRMQI
mgnify:CR=1 FL=1|jgi:flagellar hook-basal body complex protein FliE|tara:strand:- start:217 stop:528 length:312 start_codon:yes stop_codon:yes gene_type:complete